MLDYSYGHKGVAIEKTNTAYFKDGIPPLMLACSYRHKGVAIIKTKWYTPS